MRLEVRDLESSTVYDVPSGGAVIGRERAKTDIALRDESISKRHARIFLENGAWFLEDLNSSNGTFIDEVRITAPVQLAKGATFSLAQRKFEVIFIEGANGAHSSNGRASAAVSRDSGSSSGDQDEVGVGSGSDGDDDNVESKGVAYFFVAVPKAIGFYLLNVPLMAVNPIGTIRKGVEEQPHAAMGRMELAAYFIPANVFIPLLGSIVAVIATLIAGGGFAFGVLITALPMAAVSGVIGGVIGFFFHPIVTWVVNFLKGESTARSRTNYALMFLTFSVLAAVPNALAVILGSLPIPFIGLLGPLLTMVVSGIGLFLAYQWVKAFRLVKWVEYVILVLGVLTVLGAAANFVTGLIHQLTGGGPSIASGGGGTVDIPEMTDAEKEALRAAGQDPDVIQEQRKAAMAAAQAAAAAAAAGDPALAEAQAKAIAEAQAAAAAAAGAAGGDVEAAKKALEAAAAKAAEAQKLAAEAGEKAGAAGAAAGEKAAEAAEAAAEKAAEAAEKAAAKTVEKAPPPPPPPAAVAPPPPARSAPVESGRPVMAAGASAGSAPRRPAGADLEENALPSDDHPLGVTPFVEYLAKRDAVEKAIADKPEILKDKRILEDYKALWKITYEVRDKWRKQKGDRYEKEKIIVRFKDQEVFEKTRSMVDRLYAAVFPR
ncbi:MAG: FHA domain-containing protein [Deltaproteobacteria bacterium]|nr:FHA domain-containing protein [Deltaproteobacteria bacterium]